MALRDALHTILLRFDAAIFLRVAKGVEPLGKRESEGDNPR
jgi:hypothetical protein